MVNEERLRYMIKMAEFDKNEGKRCRPMEQYARKDYVSMKMLGSFITGTIAFLLLFTVWALYSMENLMKEITTMDIQAFLISVLIKYVIFIAVYLAVTYAVYNSRYTRGRKRVKRYYNNIKKLNRIYEREDKLKMSEHRKWD